MKKLRLISAALALFTALACFSGCGETPEDKSVISLLGDPTFKNGFVINKTGLGNDTGNRSVFDYGGTASGAYWQISQHSSRKSFYNGTESENNGVWTYTDAEDPEDVAKTVIVNPKTGEISLNALASNDYLAPRKDRESWPHLLIETGFTEERELDIMENLNLDISFTFTQMDNRMGAAFDTNLHSAQFQLYFVVGTRNTRDGAQQIWFGVPFFDYRQKFLSEFDGALDAGTNMFIASMGNAPLMDELVTVGKRVDIAIDLKPWLADTLDYAQNVGFMRYSTIDDLYLVNMNLGWELPGTFDVGVDIHRFNLTAKLADWYLETLA